MSKKDFDSIFSTFKLICDTRENENSHIINIFKKHNIQIVYDKLDFADYSCICCDYDFRNDIVLERKMNIDEFCNNITRKRQQFETELIKAFEVRARLQLLIEEINYIDILNEAYRSNTKQQSIIATLNTYKFRYNIDYIFLDKQASANYIYNYFKYFIREYLKQNKII